LVAAISLIKTIVLDESLGSLECAFDWRFQNRQKSSRWKPQKRLRLDNEDRLFPGSDHPGRSSEEGSRSTVTISCRSLANK
jgi:hypothetical protein